MIALAIIALFMSIFYKRVLSQDAKTRKLPESISYFVKLNIVWNACSIIGSMFFSNPEPSVGRQIVLTVSSLAWIQIGYTVYRFGQQANNAHVSRFFSVWNTLGICAVLLINVLAIFDIRILEEFCIFGIYPLRCHPLTHIYSLLYLLFVVLPIVAVLQMLFKTSMQTSSTSIIHININMLVTFLLVFLTSFTFDFVIPYVRSPLHPNEEHFLFWSQIACIFLAFSSGRYFASITYKNKSSFWLLNKITNFSSDGIICYYRDGRIKYANKTALQLFHSKLEDFQTKYVQELFSKNIEFFRESHYKGHKVSIKNEIHRFDISIHLYYTSMTSYEYLIQFCDITNTLYYQQHIKDLNEQYVEYKQDLIRYQDRLNISEKRSDENKNLLFTLINALPFQFWSKNEQGVYMTQNQKDIENRGNKTSSFDDNSVITNYEKEARTTGISKSFISYESSDKKDISQDEANVLFREGKDVFMYDNLFIPIVEKTSPYKVIGLKIDMTEQRKLEKERDMLREQKYIHSRLEELGTLCGAFAHDYNNILGSQIGFCDLAKETVAEDHPAYLFICEARKAAERGKQSLEKLLSTIRGNTETSVPPIEFSPHFIIKDVVMRFTQSLPEEVKLDSSDVDESVKIMGVVASFERVITNIVKNGIDAMKDTGGTLTIKLHAEVLDEPLEVPYTTPIPAGSYAKISISDTGAGMDAGTLERIFSPFFTTKAPGEGLGLGLSSALRLINEAKASLTVQTTLGKGTIFNLYWPQSNE